MDKIRDILDKVLQGQEYESCQDFIEAGLLDSMDVMDLVEELEQAFDIEISGRDIVPDNFRNILSVNALVQKYKEENV